MVWWLWMLVGIGLLFLELVLPHGFFAFFFGLSAIGVGALTALGLAGPTWVQWLLFSAFSVVALALLRRPLHGRMTRGTNKPVDSLIGESAVVKQDVEPHAPGKVELRGSLWNARSAASLGIGARCVVERVEGLTLWVRPE